MHVVKAAVRSSAQMHCHTVSVPVSTSSGSYNLFTALTAIPEPPGMGYIDVLFRAGHGVVSCSMHVAIWHNDS